ncbi:hypothetical protein QMK33_05345 [Hymenobacter sp. H14-R3]|uniref:hypothetical protein n=1 Tax=Hymenobacter sp. H14-R3 TaxID=3046308 RepID=UPI0024BA86AC|nr:hypothetical protein [Hymenobacter sp. H14-R3]MDJ0364569.1 hypothetical protein [Hymenobacter sp. H14-R3]
MARVKMVEGSGIAGISGRIGNLVFRMSADGVTYAQQAAGKKGPPSAAQQQHQTDFKAAAAYGREQQGSAEGRAYYQPYVQPARFGSVYSMALSDFSKPPQLLVVEADGYRGQAGAVLRVRAHKPCGVVAVQVRVLDKAGQVLEHGEATHEAGDWWTCATRATHPEAAAWQVQAIAWDRPGKTAELAIMLE